LITIKDIAREANVSPGTVDRVLHNRGGVSPKTEEKIKLILKQKKFKINLIASSLAMKRHQNLATLIPQYDDENLFWKSPFLGIQKGSHEVNAYGVENHFFTFDQFNPKSYLKAFKKLIKTQPDAVIMVPLFIKETTKIIKVLDEKKIPFLFLNVGLQGFNNICYIGQKSFEAGILAGKLLDICLDNFDELLIILTRKNLYDYEAILERVKGFIYYFNNNKPNTKIHQLQFGKPNEVEKSADKINVYLEKHPEIKGIMVPSSRISNVCRVIDADKLSHLKAVGFDTTPQNVNALAEGVVTFLISQKSFNQGYKSIITMSNYLVQKELPKNEISTPLEILTMENYKFSHSEERNYFQES
jgi:LacI family transcriptional regulator